MMGTKYMVGPSLMNGETTSVSLRELIDLPL